MAMKVEVPRRLFAVEAYQRMAEAGIFHPTSIWRCEREIGQRWPTGSRHARCVINAIDRSSCGGGVPPRNPVVIHARSEPQPDLRLPLERFALGRNLTAGDPGDSP